MRLYFSDTGETEAINVMICYDMTEQECRDTPLWETEDVTRNEHTELDTYYQSIVETGPEGAATHIETDNSTDTYHQPFLRAKHLEEKTP